MVTGAIVHDFLCDSLTMIVLDGIHKQVRSLCWRQWEETAKTFWVGGKVNEAGFAFWTEILWSVIEFVVEVCHY